MINSFFKELNLPLQGQPLGQLLSSSEKAAQIIVMTSRQNCPITEKRVHGNVLSTTHLCVTPIKKQHANEELETISISQAIVATGTKLSDRNNSYARGCPARGQHTHTLLKAAKKRTRKR